MCYFHRWLKVVDMKLDTGESQIGVGYLRQHVYYRGEFERGEGSSFVNSKLGSPDRLQW